MTAPEYRTQVRHWFVEIGVCDGNGIGQWVETEESVEVAGEAEAEALRDEWLASGKLQKMQWGELRPNKPYGLFRIRQVWADIPAPPSRRQVMNDDDMIRRGDALAAVTQTAIRWGVTGEPGILVAAKDAIRALPAVVPAETALAAEKARVAKLVEALTNLPAVYAHQINTGVREVYDPLQRFYTMESVLAAITEAGK